MSGTVGSMCRSYGYLFKIAHCFDSACLGVISIEVFKLFLPNERGLMVPEVVTVARTSANLHTIVLVLFANCPRIGCGRILALA